MGESEEARAPVTIGSQVLFTDPAGKPRPALVTAVWGGYGGQSQPSINLVVVSDDPAKDDQYGRQIEHATSVPHRSNQAAPGNYWT